MNIKPRDPLLAIARGLLFFLMVVTAIGIVACLVAAPALLLLPDTVVINDNPDLIADPRFAAALIAICVLAAGLLGVLFQIFRQLRRIVDTVAQGDPFVPDNARRLTQMAWLALAVQIMTVPLSALGGWIDDNSGTASGTFVIEQGISGNGLLLMLVLFILARVFRHGAAMRDDLEGTV